jgi:hypothetical protein
MFFFAVNALGYVAASLTIQLPALLGGGLAHMDAAKSLLLCFACL